MVLLKLPVNEALLRPGQTVSARIITGTLPDAFVIGRHFRKVLPEGEFIYLKRGNRAQRCTVKVIDIGDGLSIVRNGIASGDTVIAADALADGVVIRLANRGAGQKHRAN